MPLTRLNEAFRADFDGIHFGMTDGTQNFTCVVRYEALDDYVRGTPTQQERVEIFEKNRSFIEGVASAKYDAGHIRRDGRVRVDTRDLNPDQFNERPPRQ